MKCRRLNQPGIDAANFPAQTRPPMPSLTLKPTHKAVAACYDSLAQFARLRHFARRIQNGDVK
jgi:hypothetical protein